ncbi:MAG: hypothetical protein AAFX99_26550 [Myxococcota bacterium]
MHRTAPAVAALVIASTLWLTPNFAHAEALKLWFGGRGAYFSGQSDLFNEFDQPYGGGLEVGVELLYITVFAEALAMSSEQFLITGNIGLDATFGDDVRFQFGVYTGPILFVFPKDEEAGTLDIDGTLSSAEQDELQGYLDEAGTGLTIDDVEQEYATYSEQEQELSRFGFGWNLARARLALDFKIAPVIYFGVTGSVGYHYIISGEEAAAGAKNQAIDEFSKQYGLSSEAADLLRTSTGAEAVDVNSLNGINYEGGLYLRFEFSTPI